MLMTKPPVAPSPSVLAWRAEREAGRANRVALLHASEADARAQAEACERRVATTATPTRPPRT
jgi:hypothetical protein